jgi:hypothetical protein
VSLFLNLILLFFEAILLLSLTYVIGTMLTNRFLRQLKERALRKGVWFKVLDRVDRGIFNLTIEIVERVQSLSLARQIMNIMVTLRDALESEFEKFVNNFGVFRLIEIVEQAVNMGYIEALKWRNDSTFSRYLAMNKLNDTVGW